MNVFSTRHWLCLFACVGCSLPLLTVAAQEPSSPPPAAAKNDPAGSEQKDAPKSTPVAEAKESDGANASDASQDSQEAGPKRKREEKGKSAEKKEKTLAKKQLRLLALRGAYEDMALPPGLDVSSLLLEGAAKTKSFYKLCDYVDELATEENLAYVLFDLSDDSLSFNSAQLDELSRHLAKLKANGKKSIAWLENAGNIHLSIAATCDEVIMTDFGGVDMPSSAMASMFYRDAMDLIGVKASVVRAGDFKGAVEPYTNPVMSEHLKSHYLKMLESINGAQVSRIAKGRGLTVAAVRELQKKRMLLPSEALAAGLISKLAPYGSMKATVQEMIGKEIEWTKPKSKPKREMSFFEFMSKAMAGPKEATKIKEDSIAILHLSGTIVDGKTASPGSIVSGPMVKVIEELMNDEHVRGVVVRINSPGGSATASEAIRQALDQLAHKKPMVMSMGEMAASGGYWVTCIGQPIYAEQGTITGSIGVFSLKLSLGSMFRRVGVHVESVALDESAAADSIDRSWSESEVTNMQRFIDEVYERFLKIASTSRNLPVETVKQLAGGRVWSGAQAKQHGLIDEIGGVDDCLAVIAKKASLSKYKVIHRPEVASGFDLFRVLDEQNEEEVSVSQSSTLKLLQHQMLNLLREQGFRMETTRILLESSLTTQRTRPMAWALFPAEWKLR